MALEKERSVVEAWVCCQNETSRYEDPLAFSVAYSRRVLSQLITRNGKAEPTSLVSEKEHSLCAPFPLAHHLDNLNTLSSEVGETSRTSLLK